ncbi:helix-turn-helix domain-containing protein [Nocardia brasiliensis]|uniref:helix-turn-helix domain-containing protein n=1 Tax=Nocardia brasiliensis TaxID=37326 RepID=UPI003D8EF859
MVTGPQPLGSRIAQLRRAEGWTQAGLGMRLNRSASWVTKVERGLVIIDSTTMLDNIARTFKMSAEALIGQQPPAPRPATARASRMVSILDRPAVMMPDARSIRPLSQLARQTGVLRWAYNRSSSSFLSAAGVLPQLIIETTARARQADSPRDKATTQAVLANLYRLGSLDLRHRGDHFHARMALDRSAAAAENSDDPVLVAAIAATMTNELMIDGHPGTALALAADAIEFVERQTPSPDADHVRGALNLYAAQAAARASTPAHAMQLLAAAQNLARHDDDRYSLIFGPANVAVQTAGINVDLRRPHAALDVCAELRVRHLGSVNRLAYFQLHRSRAHGMAGNLDGALSALLAAWQAAPHIVLTDAFGQQQVAELLDKKRRYDPVLRQIARQMSLL